MDKRSKKGQALVDKVLHRKSNIEQHEAQGNLEVDSDNNLTVYRKCLSNKIWTNKIAYYK